jgi:hypothetical protein
VKFGLGCLAIIATVALFLILGTVSYPAGLLGVQISLQTRPGVSSSTEVSQDQATSLRLDCQRRFSASPFLLKPFHHFSSRRAMTAELRRSDYRLRERGYLD